MRHWIVRETRLVDKPIWTQVTEKWAKDSIYFKPENRVENKPFPLILDQGKKWSDFPGKLKDKRGLMFEINTKEETTNVRNGEQTISEF